MSSTDDRIPEHHSQYQVENPGLRIREIINALDVLEHNLRIGRPVSKGTQELVIGRQSHGYIALYRYIAEIDLFVLAIRRQREAGHAERGQGGKGP